MSVLAAMLGSECCCGGECRDCITSHVIDDTAGCCHSPAEALWFVIERPAWSVTSHVFGNHPVADPPECPGGCEISATTTFAAMPQIQAFYPLERRWFRVDYAAIETDRAPRSPCGEPCTECCAPPAFPPYEGCVCDPAALLSAYQKSVMAVTPQFMWLLDYMCHGGEQCFPPIHLPNCSELPGNTTILQQIVGVVHDEIHWKLSECSGAVTPPLYAPNDPETPISFQCIGPRRWVAACSGVPLLEIDLLVAIEEGVITQDMFCQVMEVRNGSTPPQSILGLLWEAGYLRAKDWRPEIIAGLTALKAAFPEAYASCTLPTCETLGVVGPVRKMYWPCLRADEVAEHTAPLQPDLGDCGEVDPFDGDYPEGPEDPLWAIYRTWLWTTKAVYCHARPGGRSWMCADPGVPDTALPDVPHRYSVSCPNHACLEISGYPQDWSCAEGTYAGVNPITGLSTCAVGCFSEAETFPNEWGCIFPDLGCDNGADGSTCTNVAIGSNCHGMHFVYTSVRVRNVEVSECHPSGREFYWHRKNHAFLFAVNRTCGDWETECHQCRQLEVPIEVANILPDVTFGSLAILGLCAQVTTPACGQSGSDLPCGTYCLDGDGCTVLAVADACEAEPTLEEREVCP